MKVPIVLLIAERGQNLATTMLIGDIARDLLHDLQQLSTQPRLQLQQRPSMPLGDHDHMIGSEPATGRL
nr:hypothetical protein [Nocardia aobensis]